MDSRMVASTDTTAAFDEHLASTVVGSVEGESAISRHKKKHGDVVIDLDAWLRAILASIYALLVAGERAPRWTTSFAPATHGGT